MPLNAAQWGWHYLAVPYNKRVPYSISNRDLDTTHSQQDLGVVVQKDLLWMEHYNKISHNAYMAPNLIRRTLPPNASTNLKRQLYLSTDRCHLTYFIAHRSGDQDSSETSKILKEFKDGPLNTYRTTTRWTLSRGCYLCTYCHLCTGSSSRT